MQTYLVGGAVRDELLGRQVTERDYVVVGATEQEMLDRGFTRVGSDFPVFLHPQTKEEYALARTERKSGNGYTGFVCNASPDVTLEQDLLRRDLTVNAMARDEHGALIDPYHGLDDLHQRTLRHVSGAFAEDPLRVFRVARFAARYAHLGFQVHADTLLLMQKMAADGELAHLTAERVWTETRRSLMENDPDVYFRVLADSQALTVWFSELPPPPHAAYDALRRCGSMALPLEARMAVLCATLSVDEATRLCARLKAPNTVSALAALVAAHLPQVCQSRLSACDVLTLFNQTDAWRKPERFTLLLKTIRCYCPDAHTDYLQSALTAAQAVDAGAIARQGLKGPDIKAAIASARHDAIADVIGEF
ncbi:CCA tRNA nucleotidyltransferase [Alteromonas sp. CYL-A6]|uniref:CCA tRNA nucleotidyltransferase n=1 Tax=Alteromonas nitratireducens TaxID=3390813 RepID=UPI0034ACE16C